MFDIGRIFLCFLLAYVIVLLMEIGHIIIKIKLSIVKPMDIDIFADMFKKNKMWRSFYALIIFSIFGYAYNSSLIDYGILSSLICGAIWVVVAFFVDAVTRVVITHPCSFTFEEYYKEKMLWVILFYVFIFITPFISLLFL